MTRFLEERGIESRFVNGLRVTTSETVDAVLKVFAGSVNTELVASLNAAGVPAVGLTGIDAALAIAEQLDPALGFVGRVVSSNPVVLDALSAAHLLPVVACVGGGRDGAVYNVNADSMAVAVASAWKADRLLFLTDVPGVLDATKSLLPLLTVATCRDLIESKIAVGGMQAKLNAASDAVNNGVGEVRIVKGSEPGVIAKIWNETADWHPKSYALVISSLTARKPSSARPAPVPASKSARPEMQDIPALLDLINGYAHRGIMLPRTEFELSEDMRDFHNNT